MSDTTIDTTRENRTAQAAGRETEEMGTEELTALNRNRAATYGLLSRLCMAEVDEPLLNELHGQLYPVSTGNADIDEGHRLIATALSNIWENTITELAADYLRTFLGHGYSGHSAAYPFESVYSSEKRLLMSSARDEVLALYRAAGLDKKPEWKEGEDHVALELEFMQVLAGRTADALEAGLEGKAISLLRSQKSFLDDHLGAWVPLLADGMRNFAKTDFYRGLSYLLEGFVETDAEFLEEVLEE